MRKGSRILLLKYVAGETISSKDITVARFEELAAKYGADLDVDDE